MKLSDFFPTLKHLNVPNVITTLGMVFGIFAAFHLTQRDLRMAIIFLFFAGVMDAVDGFAAAKLNQQTDFGKYLDTLVDFFTCVIMPIWMVFDLLDNSPLAIVGLIIYCACGLWRLAYYNTTESDGYFRGLPVPGSMMLVTMSVWFVVSYDIPTWVAAATLFIVGILMISGIKLKKYGMWQKVMGAAGVVFLVLVLIS